MLLIAAQASGHSASSLVRTSLSRNAQLGLDVAPCLRVFNCTQRRWKWKNVYRPGPPLAVINTLDPASLHPGCYINLTGQKAAEVGVWYTPIPRSNIKIIPPKREAVPKGPRVKNVIITVTSRPPVHKADTLRPFAHKVRGFLYWHCPPGVPAPFGEIRIRVIPHDDPVPTTKRQCLDSFARGYDYIQPISGLPWAQTLMRVFHRPPVEPLAELLVNNRLVTEAGLGMTKSLGQGKDRILWQFGQPFAWNFLDKVLAMDIARWPLGKEGAVRPLFDRIRLYMPAKSRDWRYTGSAICCFEPYTVPATESEPAKEAVAIRILEIREPAVQMKRCGNYDFDPKQGELLTIRGKVWYRVPAENREPPKSGLKDSWRALGLLRKADFYEEYLRTREEDRAQNTSCPLNKTSMLKKPHKTRMPEAT